MIVVKTCGKLLLLVNLLDKISQYKMYVSLNRYLYTILNVCLVDQKILSINHRSGLISYIFNKKNISIPDSYFDPIINFREYINYNLSNKFYIELTNKYLSKVINIEEIVFQNIELKFQILKYTLHEPIEYSIIKDIIKIKDILIALMTIINDKLTRIYILKIEQFNNEQKITITLTYDNL